ncbi:MAG: TetR family transcriptional regulator, partial [Rhodospirillales bacterium]|nr:TetR family transcriptional regulator [Rhodospirillales bacterium]
ASMQEICLEAKMSPGGLYRYFPSKEAIIEAIAQDERCGAAEIVQAMRGPGPLLDRLIGCAMGYFGYMRDPGACELMAEISAESLRNSEIGKRFAQIDDSGPKRLGRTIMLREPDPAKLGLRLTRADALAKLIEDRGLLVEDRTMEPSPGIDALVRGMMQAAAGGGSSAECAEQALRALAAVPEDLLMRGRPVPADGLPVTAVTPMLQAASAMPIAGMFTGGRPDDPVDAALIRRLAGIEEVAGLTPAEARGAAMRIVTERDQGLSQLRRVEPPPMSEAEFLDRLRSALARLRRPGGGAIVDRAA